MKALVYLSLIALGALSFSPDDCDIMIDTSLCLNDGKKIMVPDAKQDGLIGRWSFDDSIGIDSSLGGNHALSPPVLSRAGLGGYGASAYLNDGSFINIPNYGDVKEFSISMWVYFLANQADSDNWCPILFKGASEGESSPGISYQGSTRSLQVSLTTSSDIELLNSRAKLPLHRWTHLVVTKKEDSLRLYINGVLDQSIVTSGEVIPNDGSLFLGNTPWEKSSCSVELLIDEVSVYNRDLQADEIQSEASSSLNGVESSFIQLGCTDCTFAEAKKSCNDLYQTCNPLDLHTGGYILARLNGYADHETFVFSAGYDGDDNKLGLGLCCRI